MKQEANHIMPISRKAIVASSMLLVAIGGFAWYRVGILDLPGVPHGVTLEASGLGDLDGYRCLDAFVRGVESVDAVDRACGFDDETMAAARVVRGGLELVRQGEGAEGLARVREGVRAAPANLVFGNAYRMVVFRLQRRFLAESHSASRLTPAFPDHLQGEPTAFFEQLAETSRTREARLQLALAWVDRMLLFPALEIKAPSSVESVDVLSTLLADTEGRYVPALFARGLNHLHRPARLVWPESNTTPIDAAATDIGLCVAIGRELGVGSSRLQATLAIALGDAYVKTGSLGVARSWWQVAQNLSRAPEVKEAVRRRYGWEDGEVLDRLEEELDRARSELDRPMTDLALMWS
ncbi:MAG: hypothetical protein PVI86_12385 [Phycisphaerae bacterium]